LLVVRGVTGRPDVGAIFRAHRREVARWVGRLGGARSEVDDLVQEVFVVVQRRIGAFRGDAKLESWLFGVTRNVVRAWRRRARRRPPAEPLPLDAESQVLGCWVDEDAASALIERQAAAEGVGRTLLRMRAEDRAVLVLFEIESLSGARVSERLGCSPVAASVRRSRARARFRTLWIEGSGEQAGFSCASRGVGSRPG
jgi:RNA polymerase sigma-70 factor (ECF subfamily)